MKSILCDKGSFPSHVTFAPKQADDVRHVLQATALGADIPLGMLVVDIYRVFVFEKNRGMSASSAHHWPACTSCRYSLYISPSYRTAVSRKGTRGMHSPLPAALHPRWHQQSSIYLLLVFRSSPLSPEASNIHLIICKPVLSNKRDMAPPLAFIQWTMWRCFVRRRRIEDPRMARRSATNMAAAATRADRMVNIKYQTSCTHKLRTAREGKQFSRPWMYKEGISKYVGARAGSDRS